MINSNSSTPLELIRKESSLTNPNNSDPSESSTGESIYKDEFNEEKDEKINFNKKNYRKNKNNKENILLNKKVKRINFQSPNKKQKSNNINKNNIIHTIFYEFKSSYSLCDNYIQFNQIEKKVKNGFYICPFEFARDFRNIFSKLFSSSLTNSDYEKYNKIFILSEIFENIFSKYEKNSQIKMAQKLSEELSKLKKEITKLTRKKKIKRDDLANEVNLDEKKEGINDTIRDDIMNKIKRLNSEQKKGILKIISGNLINRNCENNIIEFNINKLPSNQLKELDVYINKCINNNINITINNNIKKETVQKEDDIQMDELSNSSSGLSDSDDDSESIELE